MTKFKILDIDRPDRRLVSKRKRKHRHRSVTKGQVSLLHSPLINDCNENGLQKKDVLLDCGIAISELNHLENLVIKYNESSHCIARKLSISQTEFSKLESSITDTFNKFVNDNEMKTLGEIRRLENCQPEFKWLLENSAIKKKREPMACVKELNGIIDTHKSEKIQAKDNLKYYFKEMYQCESKLTNEESLIRHDGLTSFLPTVSPESVEDSSFPKIPEPVKDNLSLPTVSIGKTYKFGNGMETIEIFDYGHQKVDVSKIQLVDPTSPFDSWKDIPICENMNVSPHESIVSTSPPSINRSISERIAPTVDDANQRDKLPGNIKSITKDGYLNSASNKVKLLPGIATKKTFKCPQKKPSCKSNGIWKLMPLDTPIRISFTRQNVDMKRCHVLDPRIMHLLS